MSTTTMTAPPTSSRLSTLTATTLTQQEALDHRPFTYVRALYDYNPEPPSSASLSFRKDDVLEVVGRLESGWWDGFLGDRRGWFPSNYVVGISEEEAEVLLEPSSWAESSNGSTSFDKSEDDEWHSFSRDGDRSGTGTGTESTGDPIDIAPGRHTEPSDFWLPEVTSTGQIFYVNTHTGQKSLDLPVGISDSETDLDVAGLSSSFASSRAGAMSGLGLTTTTPPNGMANGNVNGNGVGMGMGRKRAGTDTAALGHASPQSQRKTKRNTSVFFPIAEREPGISNGSGSQQRIRPLPRITALNRVSIHSDDSEIYPLERERSTSQSEGEHISSGSELGKRSSPGMDQPIIQLPQVTPTAAERLAQELQSALAPPLPPTIQALGDKALRTIGEVLKRIHIDEVVECPGEDEIAALVEDVVNAVREMVYIANVGVGVGDRKGAPGKGRHVSASVMLLKTPQRKVTATLAKLVLSARAIKYSSSRYGGMVDTPKRIKNDAEELEKHIMAFLTSIQQYTHLSRSRNAKRVHGYFSTANIGLGLPGAGTGGTWKGMGWVMLEEGGEGPGVVLKSEVVGEAGRLKDGLGDKFERFYGAFEQDDQILGRQTRDLVGGISSFLDYISNIHIARHVDVDGISREPANSSDSDLYIDSVHNARLLVRTLEAALQALYDDGSALLLASSDSCRNGERGRNYMDSLSASLKANLAIAHQTLESLLAIGHEQEDLSSGDYNGSIEWRMSRVSTVSAAPVASKVRASVASNISVVDMAMALASPSPVPRKGAQDSSDVSEIREEGGGARPATPAGTISDTDSLLDDIASTQKSPPRRKDTGSKLEKLLGTDAPRHYIETANADSKPWYLRPNYNPAEITIDPDGTVKGGTVRALVERLTAHEHAYPTFIKTFLMTYKSFTTVDDLFDLLVQRFWITPPDGLKPTELDEWRKLKQHIIKMRVLNTFKSMIVDEDVLEPSDMYILDRMREFVLKDEVNQFAAAKQLLTLIERYRQGGDVKIKMTVTTTLTSPPPPIQPKTSKKLKLLDIDTLEMARQLTIMESKLYQQIKPIECLLRSRETKADYKDNITNVTQNFNRLANWIQECVLAKEDARKRAAVVKFFISVADRCRDLHNYSSMVAIISGLNAVPVRRLKRTWELVNARFLSQLNVCESIIDPNRNFTNYRSLLGRIFPPCVPYIGVFLTTLTFVQEGSKDSLPSDLVNFRKRQKASEVIHDIKRWQSQPHNFHPIASVLVYIEESLNKFGDQPGVGHGEAFWNLSLEREPREREDEKMARLLQESGFL